MSYLLVVPLVQGRFFHHKRKIQENDIKKDLKHQGKKEILDNMLKTNYNYYIQHNLQIAIYVF